METESQFHLLAEELGFVAVFVQGTDDSPSGVTSWNIAREVGPYGDVCDRDRYCFWPVSQPFLSFHHALQGLLGGVRVPLQLPWV